MALFSLHLPRSPLFSPLLLHRIKCVCILPTCNSQLATATQTQAQTVGQIQLLLTVWLVDWLFGRFVGCSVGNWAVNFNYCQADDYTLHSADRRS